MSIGKRQQEAGTMRDQMRSQGQPAGGRNVRTSKLTLFYLLNRVYYYTLRD